MYMLVVLVRLQSSLLLLMVDVGHVCLRCWVNNFHKLVAADTIRQGGSALPIDESCAFREVLFLCSLHLVLLD